MEDLDLDCMGQGKGERRARQGSSIDKWRRLTVFLCDVEDSMQSFSFEGGIDQPTSYSSTENLHEDEIPSEERVRVTHHEPLQEALDEDGQRVVLQERWEYDSYFRQILATGQHHHWNDMNARHDYSSSCLLYTSPSPRDATLSRMPSSA